MGNIINTKDSFVLIYNTHQEAQDIVDVFPANYTEVLTNHDGTLFAVFIRPMDRHKLDQSIRDQFMPFPSDFYETIC